MSEQHIQSDRVQNGNAIPAHPNEPSSFEEWTPDLIRQQVEALKEMRGAILHAVQDCFGYIPAVAVPVIAETLRQTRSEVHGIISFYHHFRTHPAGAHAVHVCRAEACQAMGGRQLEGHIKARLGIDYHQTSRDNEFTVAPVYCLGNCACAPSIRIGDNTHGRMDEEERIRV